MIINKHKNASQDYTTAYDVVNNFEVSSSMVVDTDNKKTFRKYLSELSKFAGKKFATRTIQDNSINIIRIE